jgi:hypothetical protein
MSLLQLEENPIQNVLSPKREHEISVSALFPEMLTGRLLAEVLRTALGSL